MKTPPPSQKPDIILLIEPILRLTLNLQSPSATGIYP